MHAVTGEPPKKPVFSKITGNVFEKHVLELYLAEHQTDPVTQQPATVDDYVELKGRIIAVKVDVLVPEIARPRPANLTSIPSLLSVFQSEWDALALETFTLRKQLLETRQELSTALYQHDAACRVIARLQKERDEAREALAKVSIDGVKTSGEEMDVDTNGIPTTLAEKITTFKDEAHAKRKKRKMSPNYATIDALRGIRLVSHGERISSMFTSCALDPESNYNLALFGPEGGLNSVIYDLSTHEWKGQLSDEQGDILDVEWYDRGPITAGSNGTISVWSPQGSIKFKLKAHEGPVVGVDLHPMGDFLVSASRDGDWAIHDLANEKTVARFRDDASTSSLN
jgi:pre-mRNA-processing factor 19